MKKRWPLVVAYAFAVLVQAGLLGGAYALHLLSQEKMMVMRYLVARNLELEAFWFSHEAVRVQAVAFLVIGAGLLVWAFALLRRRARFAGAQALLGAVLCASGAWLTLAVSVDDVWALYAAVISVGLALLLQLAVIAVAARSAGKR